LRAGMKESRVRGAFVVGGGDGALPMTMKAMAEAYGTRAAFHVIDGAGHLPMVEKPQVFAEIVTRSLARR
jgi:pimeloyl-ACP methyl ester carboxylesterase